MTSYAIIVAAGKGARAKRDKDQVPKQYVKVGGKAVLSWTLESFLTSDHIDHIQVVISASDDDLYQTVLHATQDNCHLANLAKTKLLPPCHGGSTRQLSVFAGLQALKNARPKDESAEIDHVHIHDGARPFVSNDILQRCEESLIRNRACLVGMPLSDTIKRTNNLEEIEVTLDRTNLWSAQTPQSFQLPFILTAHEKAHAEGISDFTDDAAVAEWAGATVQMVEGSRNNIKITTQEDLTMAEQTLGQFSSALLTDIRVGTGYDVHAFDPGNVCIIGGVAIPHDKKLKGHSDADVGLHAITDAILGAIADGDIGTHFPPSDPQWKGAKSDIFLKDAVRRVNDLGGKISNIDMTIVCEEPKIGPHRPAIREAIADICSISINRVSVKATTSERLGFTGSKEGVAAIATVCIRLPEYD
ncbi:MAG TPA: bifunctional 2-C-methyl-D-erythritol 4-phosphate cytidylyltransferase/2-C-methyl-D-erythritol 2,4-cyclodiphosphate synthase [Rhizobiales bacterium]|nr:bifunctional 2-C-methyl-D-erythritol 4-phosphate cytidylyltransferase/2-C-methyl-D-erythritol 2,4-cyclodiphosphate synthase [Hyphomicrobiales bacterium]